MTLWTAIGAIALISFAFKAIGPAVLGGRELPVRARSVMVLWAPALLASLATVVVLRHYRASMPVTLVGAVAVTALLRLWFS
ncbi:Branched-chain amino acid transport [Streptomyces venezuelae]|uniref:hypothetical protein n=1 Tax=Streptomyces gardneri TaxID=66892 RepID=UPI0006BC9AEE|nr:hypothetical protein [Streptomyces gardneri]ALO06596.1 Branched-chain amino acid transport [Streptomyces venezuelae]QPK44012.1 branched-chain amino acid ABC transporter [Streptomyces gardneri]WRK35284.1 hypothetical protein U0M97_04925 [Streptomyces venezuelae]CUM43128.1 hypothetical protein BN2537_15221 [Streptomyces venezuelae]